jgi:hypothetical protein
VDSGFRRQAKPGDPGTAQGLIPVLRIRPEQGGRPRGRPSATDKSAAILPRGLITIRGKEETMVATKVATNVVGTRLHPQTAGTLGVPAVFIFSAEAE